MLKFKESVHIFKSFYSLLKSINQIFKQKNTSNTIKQLFDYQFNKYHICINNYLSHSEPKKQIC